MDSRRLIPAALIGLGVIIAISSLTYLVLRKLSLPPYTFQTEGKYVAYGLEVWLHGFWVIPLCSIVTLLGILVYPFTSFRKEIFAVVLAFGLGALAMLTRSASSIIGHWVESGHLPTVFQIFAGFVGMFLPLSAMLLMSIFAARRMWRFKR